MIDDFRGGYRPPRKAAAARRPVQYSRRFNPAPTDLQPIDDFSAQADAIAVAFDDPMFSDASRGTLPPPVINPLFGSSQDDGPGTADGSSDDGSGDDPDNDTKGTKSSKDSKRGSSDTDHWYSRPFRRLGAAAGQLTRRQWLIITGVFLIVAGACTSAYILTSPQDKQAPAVAATPKPKPLPPPPPPVSPLTGMEVSAEDAKRVVTGVMIENSTNARPQSGLQEAGIVYEAIAEYGITRFLALYQEAKPGNIGPVRSARPYFVDWAHSYDAPYAHVGGSPDALAKIRNEGIKDLDQFYNSGAYRRINSRFAPHNVYTTMGQLNDIAAAKGWTNSTFTGFARKKETPAAPAKRTATKVDIAISGPTYNTHYDYDPAGNRYLRAMAGAAHKDADSGHQITPKVVVAIATDYGLEPDGYHSKYRITGSGQAFIFQDGTVTTATWNRETPTSQYVFTGSDNKPVKLNAGQTWITVVGTPGAVTYTP